MQARTYHLDTRRVPKVKTELRNCDSSEAQKARIMPNSTTLGFQVNIFKRREIFFIEMLKSDIRKRKSNTNREVLEKVF